MESDPSLFSDIRRDRESDPSLKLPAHSFGRSRAKRPMRSRISCVRVMMM